MTRGLLRLLILLVFCVVVALSSVGLILYLTHRDGVSKPTFTVTWKISTNAFTQEDQQAIEKAVQDTIAKQAKAVPRPLEVDIITTQREGNWATFNTLQRVSTTEVLAIEPGFFIARKDGASWSLLLPGAPTFCDQLQQVPDTLLTPIDKRYFCMS